MDEMTKRPEAAAAPMRSERGRKASDAFRLWKDSDKVEMTLGELGRLLNGARDEGIAAATAVDMWADLDEWEDWAPALKQFRANPRAAKPDIEALARLLRNDKPLPSPVRHALASLLLGEANWRLRPVYTRRSAAKLREARNEKLLEDAMAVNPLVTNAIAEIEEHGVMSKRTAWAVWTRTKAKRAYAQAIQKENPGLATLPGLVKELLDRVRLPPLDEATMLAEVYLELRKIAYAEGERE